MSVVVPAHDSQGRVAHTGKQPLRFYRTRRKYLHLKMVMKSWENAAAYPLCSRLRPQSPGGDGAVQSVRTASLPISPGLLVPEYHAPSSPGFHPANRYSVGGHNTPTLRCLCSALSVSCMGYPSSMHKRQLSTHLQIPEMGSNKIRVSSELEGDDRSRVHRRVRWPLSRKNRPLMSAGDGDGKSKHEEPSRTVCFFSPVRHDDLVAQSLAEPVSGIRTGIGEFWHADSAVLVFEHQEPSSHWHRRASKAQQVGGLAMFWLLEHSSCPSFPCFVTLFPPFPPLTLKCLALPRFSTSSHLAS